MSFNSVFLESFLKKIFNFWPLWGPKCNDTSLSAWPARSSRGFAPFLSVFREVRREEAGARQAPQRTRVSRERERGFSACPICHFVSCFSVQDVTCVCARHHPQEGPVVSVPAVVKRPRWHTPHAPWLDGTDAPWLGGRTEAWQGLPQPRGWGREGEVKSGSIASSPVRTPNWSSGPPITTPQSPPRSTMVRKVLSNSASWNSYSEFR